MSATVAIQLTIAIPLAGAVLIALTGRWPNLRLVRTLEAGQVLTIEPGLYFIDSLLNEVKNGPSGNAI
ncbi:MAG: hypothetical protein ACE5DS_03040, partial [Kiloniellaceae bacterium]